MPGRVAPRPLRVCLLMANCTRTAYFTRFANEAPKTPGFELTFISLFPERPEMLDEMAKLGYACHWIPFDCSKKKRGYVTAFFRLLTLFLRLKPDVVHTHLFDDSLPGLLAARVAGVKARLITKLDSGFHHLFRPRYVALDRFNNSNATRLVAVSNENKRFAVEIERCPPEKVTLIHQGVPASEVTTRSPELRRRLLDRYGLQGKKVILTVGRFSEIKGYRHIVPTAKIISERHRDVRFLWVGDGDRSVLEGMIRSSGLEEVIILSDWINREELNNLYSLADVYLHAALIEPFGFVIAEAMLNGVPVVSTRVGAAADALIHKVSGYLVDPEDSAGLADGISHMLTNDTKELAARALRAANELFTIEAMWAKHAQLYQASAGADQEA